MPGQGYHRRKHRYKSNRSDERGSRVQAKCSADCRDAPEDVAKPCPPALKSRCRVEHRGKHNTGRDRHDTAKEVQSPSVSDRSQRRGASGDKPLPMASSSSTSTDSVLEIPGFYYDREKKKYFRILPGHKNTHAGVVTKESIKKKEREQSRGKDIKLLSAQKSCPKKHDSISKHLSSKGKNKKSSCNLFDLIATQANGDINETKFKTGVCHIYRSNLKPCCHTKVFKSPTGSYERLEHMQKMYPSQKFNNQLICLWTLNDLLVQRIQTIAVDNITHGADTASLDISLTGAMIPKAFSKITGMCSAAVHCGTDVKEYILYTTMCVIGNNPSMAMLRNLNCSGAEDFRYTEFNLGSMATWCCAWNPHTMQFSIGTEKHGLLLDVETRRLWELNTQKSDVLAQVFSNDGKLLCSGSRMGVTFAHDLRSNSTASVFRLTHKAGVCSLRMSTDDNYIYTADFGSKIQRWDLRQRRVLKSYPGHQNDYSILPVHVSEDEDLIYAVGQDCYTRLWDLQTGKLVKHVPPPYEASIDTIPVVHYTSQMTHRGSRPGLFMGIRDELHFYSL